MPRVSLSELCSVDRFGLREQVTSIVQQNDSRVLSLVHPFFIPFTATRNHKLVNKTQLMIILSSGTVSEMNQYMLEENLELDYLPYFIKLQRLLLKIDQGEVVLLAETASKLAESFEILSTVCPHAVWITYPTMPYSPFPDKTFLNIEDLSQRKEEFQKVIASIGASSVVIAGQFAKIYWNYLFGIDQAWLKQYAPITLTKHNIDQVMIKGIFGCVPGFAELFLDGSSSDDAQAIISTVVYPAMSKKPQL